MRRARGQRVALKKTAVAGEGGGGGRGHDMPGLDITRTIPPSCQTDSGQRCAMQGNPNPLCLAALAAQTRPAPNGVLMSSQGVC